MVPDASAAGGRKVELDGDMRWTSQGMNEAAHGGQNRRRNESQGETNMRERRRARIMNDMKIR